MRAMAVTDYHAPLELINLPVPQVKPGFVLIRILTCGVCYSDYKTARGRMAYSPTLKLPHVPGHEICGEVVEAAPVAHRHRHPKEPNSFRAPPRKSSRGGNLEPPEREHARDDLRPDDDARETGLRVGERVIVYNYWSCERCAYCRMGLENLCENLQGWVGFTTPGGFEEFLTVPADRLLRLPAGISPEQAAPTSCALGTSYRAVVTRGQVRPGQTVVVQGVGGVGLNSLQVARAAGARVLAVDIDRRHLDAAARLGAEKGALAGEAARAMVRDFTAGLGADVVIDTVGHEETLHEAAMLSRRGGRVVGVGYVVGGFARVQTDDFVLREIEFVGSRYVLRHELERAISLLASGQVQPVIDDVLPLESANEAFARLEQGKVIGRTVLRVAE